MASDRSNGGGRNDFSPDKILPIESFGALGVVQSLLNLNMCFIDYILLLLQIVVSIDVIYL